MDNFVVNMGIPEMKKFWFDLEQKVISGKANKDEKRLYKQLGKALKFLAQNPKHPGLHTHEIKTLTEKVNEGGKVWESYLENNTPGAGRIFWQYGPNKGDITIIGLAPHPNKSSSYENIVLSKMQ